MYIYDAKHLDCRISISNKSVCQSICDAAYYIPPRILQIANISSLKFFQIAWLYVRKLIKNAKVLILYNINDNAVKGRLSEIYLT